MDTVKAVTSGAFKVWGPLQDENVNELSSLFHCLPLANAGKHRCEFQYSYVPFGRMALLTRVLLLLAQKVLLPFISPLSRKNCASER